MVQALAAAEPSTALVEIEDIKLPATYTKEQIDDVLDKIKKAIAERMASGEMEISRADGRKARKSLGRKLRSTKTALDDFGKDLVSGKKAECALIDAERRRVRETVDGWVDELLAPVEALEQIERDRVAGHEAEIAHIQLLGSIGASGDPIAVEIASALAQLDALPPRDWREFTDRATKAISIAREDLSARLARRQQRDTEAVELARLQAEEAERKRIEHEARIAAIAAENAKREAEEAAEALRQAEAARAERERLAEAQRVEVARLAAEEAARLERERIEAAAKAEREAAEARERELQAERDRIEAQRRQSELDRIAAENAARIAEERRVEAAQQAQRDREEAARKAEQDRADAAARAEADRVAAAEKAKRDQEAALAAERQRVAKIAQDEAAARQRREEDVANRKAVNHAARDALVLMFGTLMSDQVAARTMTDDEALRFATEIVKAIALGKIPGVTISY